MAGFGWNMRQGNVHENDSNVRKRPFPTTQHIACRICNKVFLNTHSLINHIETHMVHYENPGTGAARRQLEVRQLTANPNFRNNLTLQAPARPPPPQPPVQLRPVSPVNPSQLSRKNLVFGPQLPRNYFGQPRGGNQIHRQYPIGDDFTKPLIDQLQKKIPDFEILDESDQMLDLTLKL